MKLPHYHFSSNSDCTEFYFESIGNQGKIEKVVRFEFFNKVLVNLAFGDKFDGSEDFDDAVVSNNGDLKKVLATVAQIAFVFSDKNPNLSIAIIPVDEKRRNLYNYVFKKHHQSISEIFEIVGKPRGFPKIKKMPYQPDIEFELFQIRRKIQ